MSGRRGESPGAGRTVPGWIKILVGLHVFACIVWATPLPPPLVAQERIKPQASGWLLYWNAKYLKSNDLIQAYVLSTGTWQYWDMFAPNPSNVDWYCDAEVLYKDGTKRIVGYPRIFSLSIPQKYLKERYRKFFERAHDPSKPRIWPVFGQAMANIAYQDKANPPLVVRLRQHSRTIAPPGARQEVEYRSYEYYAYAVDQAWLRAEAGIR